ncbi:hypothetical protein [Coxiella burnetii]|uniref:hypothetical protein n=3 Tax=Coxiella burnetii TaxID=777 RepID=UPI0035A93E08
MLAIHNIVYVKCRFSTSSPYERSEIRENNDVIYRPVFRFAHTYMDPPLLSTISFDEKKAVAFVYPASRFKLATIGALMNYARLMLIGLSASQSHRMNQLNQPQVLSYFHQPSLFRTRLVCLLLLILFFTHGGV